MEGGNALLLAWIIVLVLLLLFLILPVGVDAAFARSQFALKVKLGPLGIRILPGKEGKKKEKKPKEPRPKQEKPKQEAETKKKARLKLTKDDIVTLLKIVFRALHRFRTHLSIDLLRLHWTAGAEDPYDAVIQYGGLNAGLNTVYPLAHKVLHIREEDIGTDLSYGLTKPEIDARVVATLQIWEILLIGICAGAALLRWYWKKRRNARGADRPMAQKGTQ